MFLAMSCLDDLLCTPFYHMYHDVSCVLVPSVVPETEDTLSAINIHNNSAIIHYHLVLTKLMSLKGLFLNNSSSKYSPHRT